MDLSCLRKTSCDAAVQTARRSTCAALDLQPAETVRHVHVLLFECPACDAARRDLVHDSARAAVSRISKGGRPAGAGASHAFQTSFWRGSEAIMKLLTATNALYDAIVAERERSPELDEKLWQDPRRLCHGRSAQHRAPPPAGDRRPIAVHVPRTAALPPAVIAQSVPPPPPPQAQPAAQLPVSQPIPAIVLQQRHQQLLFQ
jgi:hypothetical protein